MWIWYWLFWSSIMISTQHPTAAAAGKQALDPKFRLSPEWWAAAKATDEAKKKAAERRSRAASCP